ncbi:MAG: CHAD domain-containing protein [Candidatus Marinimicrobia bacterium]|nr:CHAD domain-containing protein [Candidatus Neomarinimicrobiota bacterium]
MREPDHPVIEIMSTIIARAITNDSIFLNRNSNHSTDSIGSSAAYIAVVSSVQKKIKTLLMELQKFLADIESQPELAIHGIRKRTKYIRALLAIDPASATELRGCMKKLSSILASYRDARVNLDTYQTIIQINNSLTNPAIETRLKQNSFLAKQLPVDTELEIIKHLLEDFIAQLESCSHAISDDQMLQRIESSFHSGKKGLERVKREANVRAIHAWRKKTKLLWYQLRFLFGDELEEHEHPLVLSNALGKLLGEIHDLDVLMKVLDLQPEHPFNLWVQELRQNQVVHSLKLGHTLYVQQRSTFYHILKPIH